MAQTSRRQRKTTGRVMHEFKHGELKRGRKGKGGKVKSRRQAIAIALHEAGASKSQNRSQQRKERSKTERKERQGKTAQQEKEGKSHIGARGRKESSGAMRRANGKRSARRGSARSRGGPTKRQLYERARAKGIRGRSKMSKSQLQRALG